METCRDLGVSGIFEWGTQILEGLESQHASWGKIERHWIDLCPKDIDDVFDLDDHSDNRSLKDTHII